MDARVLGMARVDARPRTASRREARWDSASRRSTSGPSPRPRRIGSPPTHDAAGSDDLCFLTASTPDEVVRHLKSGGVAIVAGPGPRRGARGTLTSVYCRDPDGSLIEIASYQGG